MAFEDDSRGTLKKTPEMVSELCEISLEVGDGTFLDKRRLVAPQIAST
jgi:hypothetical protein